MPRVSDTYRHPFLQIASFQPYSRTYRHGCMAGYLYLMPIGIPSASCAFMAFPPHPVHSWHSRILCIHGIPARFPFLEQFLEDGGVLLVFLQ